MVFLNVGSVMLEERIFIPIDRVPDKIKEAFIYADNGLTDLPGEQQLVKSEYHAIGGRQNSSHPQPMRRSLSLILSM